MKRSYKTRAALLALTTTVLSIAPASANNIMDSILGTGLVNLVNDASFLLIILCPLVGAAAAGWFAIRRSMSDEQDGKMWEKRIKVAIICGVGGCLTSAIIAIGASYFQA